MFDAVARHFDIRVGDLPQSAVPLLDHSCGDGHRHGCTIAMTTASNSSVKPMLERAQGTVVCFIPTPCR
jgi:hypothetical protein